LFFFLKKEQNLFLFKKMKKKGLKKTTKNPCELFLFKTRFFSTLIIIQSFFVIFP